MSLFDSLWPAWRQLVGVHSLLYRATGGKIGHRVPGAPPTLLLEHVGARSGERRRTPLSYLEDGEDLVIVASKGGHPRHPAWLHNLRAHPETTVTLGREQRAVRAREAAPQERARLWPQVVAMHSGYEGYQARTEREIPLVILEPRQQDTGSPA